MPIQTDLNVSPYFDDYKDSNDYYKILFRPGVAVQTRELNQLQTILQRQVERFGDNIFKRGTIIDGCDITFHSVFPYVKIKDVETNGAPVSMGQLIGYNLKNQANLVPLKASIITGISGFESQTPDLNTIYLRYTNSGFANVAGVRTGQTTYAANQQLTVYDARNIIEKITSYNDSAGFANTDNVVILSAIAIQNSTGGTSFANNFFVGDYINDGTANVEIVEKDTTSNSQVVILRIKPRALDLKAANSVLWTLTVNTNIQSTNAAPSDLANVVSIIGTGAAATLKTGGLGEVDMVSVTQKGAGYYVLPTVSIASTGATTGQIATANLVPQNFLTTITVANNSVSPVGTGYAMTVGEGIVYQKGYFTRVDRQLVVVEKYANTPNLKSVGFDTNEDVINSNQDQSLLDNATGAPNQTAPGANRLKLTPRLVVKTKAEAEANANFLAVAEFSAGTPYKQNRQTVYNVIGNEMARRTFEESGNYVIDQFMLNTKSPTSLIDESTQFNILVDPGVAYINGKRIATYGYYTQLVDKGTDTITTNNAIISLNYGNYIRMNQVGGTFIFKTGDQVTLYGTPAKEYVSTSAGQTISSAGLGTNLGTARIRSFVHESGTPGTAEAVYRLYLFDIRLATARNFTLVRTVFYDGVNKAIGDAILENGVAVLKDNNRSSLVYYAGRPAVKAANNISYTYRTFTNTHSIASNGVITLSVTGGESFPYTGALSTNQENEVVIVPLANVQYSANISGALSCNTTSTQVNGTSTAFTTQLQAGDFIKINGTTVAQVNNIANNTALFVKSLPSGAATGNAVIYFPQNIPISLDRTTRTANVNINSNTMYIDLGQAVNTATTVALAYNVRSANTQAVTKTVNRDRYIRLRLTDNAALEKGPWVLGIPDVFRLKTVHIGPNATFSDTDVTNVTDITESFYIDHNQTEDYYGISYLYKRPNANVTLTTSDFLLVKLDHFIDSAEGLKTPGEGSYNIDDGVSLASSTSSINTIEIPEMYGAKGDYYDLRDQFDLRPQSANTVTANAVPANAPINPQEPSNSARFSGSDKKFPAPDSVLTGTIEYYVGRTDRVVVDDANQFNTIRGTAGVYIPPVAPLNALTINIINIPPYPSIPYQPSAQTAQFIDTKIANEKYTGKRLDNYRITTTVSAAQRNAEQPRGYTMNDIGSLERRIADLEYYTRITLTEALTSSRSIPSSANSSLERFKFGFFVDNFNDTSYSDITNPGYSASVVNGFLAPKADQINLQLVSTSSGTGSLDYIEYPFISQLGATDGPVYVAPNPPPPVPVVDTEIGTVVTPPPVVLPPPDTVVVDPDGLPTTVVTPVTGNDVVTPPTVVVTPTVNTTIVVTAPVVQSIVNVVERERTRSNSDSGLVYEEFFYTMSTLSGPAEFYINSRDNNIALEVFQSSTSGGPWTSLTTSASALPITESDLYSKSLSGINDNRKIEHMGSLNRKSYGPVGYFIEDQFKLLWNHNPDNGLYYKLRVYKGKNHGGQGKSGTYGFKLFYPVDASTSTASDNFTTGYSIESFGYFPYLDNDILASIDYDSNYSYGSTSAGAAIVPTPVVSQPSYVVSDQRHDFTVTGLRASTEHNVFLAPNAINLVDINSAVKQIGGTLGGGLVSDENGVINFATYYNSEVPVTSEATRQIDDLIRAAGTKTITLTGAEGLSTAEITISLPDWVAADINQAPIVAPASIASAGGSGGGYTGGREFDQNNVQEF